MSNPEDQTENTGNSLLSWIGPVVVLGCMLLDISSRFIPPAAVCFRAWEEMQLFATNSGPFVPGTVYSNPKSYGDLANLGNLPHMRQCHQEVFSTDTAGYRNQHTAATPFNGILLLGDSFAAGSGVTDEQSLGRQIARISGLPVYNAAASSFNALDDLQMNCGLVIWEQSERNFLLSVPEIGWKGRLIRGLGNHGQMVRSVAIYLSSWWSYSPMQIWCDRAVKVLQNDRVLPNPYRQFVESRRLSNGQEILFLSSEVQNYKNNRTTDSTFFIQLRDKFQAKGIPLLVVLVPDKYVVYHDLLSSATPSREKPKPLFMDIVAARLSEAHIPVVNLISLERVGHYQGCHRDRQFGLVPKPDQLFSQGARPHCEQRKINSAPSFQRHNGHRQQPGTAAVAWDFVLHRGYH
jgi:hypothetical protein